MTDISGLPKLFCDNVLSSYTAEHFNLVLFAGEEPHPFACTPEHMKRLALHLAHQVAEYERTNGVIDAHWSPAVRSPIQTKDLQEG